MKETLRQKQSRFALYAARLILKADELGYAVTIGEVERRPDVAAANARAGIGISNSLHLKRLAVDLHLFKDGRYISNWEGHAELGQWWKSLHLDNCWGGDFASRDYNHYSLSPDGITK